MAFFCSNIIRMAISFASQCIYLLFSICHMSLNSKGAIRTKAVMSTGQWSPIQFSPGSLVSSTKFDHIKLTSMPLRMYL